MLTIIESGPRAWALAAADGNLHVYSREEAGEWSEVLLSDDTEQIDQDGGSILEALYEQYATYDGNEQTEAPEAEPELPEDEEEQPEDEEEPEDEDEEPADEEEDKPRRSRARARTRKK